MRWMMLALCGCGRLAFDEQRASPDATTEPDAALPVPMLVGQVGAQTNQNPHVQMLPVTAGDRLIVVSGSLSMVTDVTDSQGNPYTQLLLFENTTTDGAVWSAIASATGTDTITVTYAQANTHTTDLFAYAHVGARDTTSTTSGVTGTAITSGPATTTRAGDLLLFFTHQNAQTTWTAPPGYTIRADNQHTFVADALAGAAGTYEATSTASQSQAWDAHLIAFFAQ